MAFTSDDCLWDTRLRLRVSEAKNLPSKDLCVREQRRQAGRGDKARLRVL